MLLLLLLYFERARVQKTYAYVYTRMLHVRTVLCIHIKHEIRQCAIDSTSTYALNICVCLCSNKLCECDRELSFTRLRVRVCVGIQAICCVFVVVAALVWLLLLLC